MMIKNIKSNLIPKNLHAFFTNKLERNETSKISLDFSFSQKQNKEVTKFNHRLAVKSLGCLEKDLHFLCQTHSSKVLFVGSTSNHVVGRADAMVTNDKDKILAILTADCAPVIFFDPVSRVIGAAHAGWRGANLGILENTIDAMKSLGVKSHNISASIGPCISQKNYEVGEDLKSSIVLHNRENDDYFSPKPNNKYLFDLCGFIQKRLERYGINRVDSANICTYEENNNFHSYRHAIHNKYANYRRNITLITL